MTFPSTTADTIYNLARILILLATVFGVTGTIGLFWAGTVRERQHTEYHEEQLVEAQKASLKWETEATLARRELDRLQHTAAASAPTTAAAPSPAASQPTGSFPTLSNEQKSAAISRLKFLAKAPVRLGYRMDGSDAQAFGELLQKLLTDSEFSVTHVNPGEQSNGPGVTVVVGRAETPPLGAMELIGVLNGLGVPNKGVAANTDEITDIFIEVAPLNRAP